MAAELAGPHAAGSAAVQAVAAVARVARSAADRELDEDERNAVDVIATAAALVAGSRSKEYG